MRRSISILTLALLTGCGGENAVSDLNTDAEIDFASILGDGWTDGFVSGFTMSVVRSIRSSSTFSNNVTTRGGRPLIAGRVDYARSVGLTGAGQIIAMFDNGVDLDHETFDGVNVTYATDSNLSAPQEHGTAVASIMVGRGGSGSEAVEGVASGADLFLATWDYDDSTTWSERARMVNEAANAGAIVMNNSWVLSRDFTESAFVAHFSQSSSAYSYVSAIRNFAENGVVVFALSNDTVATDAYNIGALPLLYTDLQSNWLTVVNGTATYNENNILSVTRKSSACLETAAFCITADGTINVATAGTTSGYEEGTGTSYATPQISGAIALLAEAFPDLTAAQLRARLLATSDNSWMTDFTGYVDFGSGIVHYYNDEFGHGFYDLKNALLPIGSAVVPVSASDSIDLLAGDVGALAGPLSGSGLATALASETASASDSLNGTFDIPADALVGTSTGYVTMSDIVAMSSEPRVASRLATAPALQANLGYTSVFDTELMTDTYLQTGNSVREIDLGDTSVVLLESPFGSSGIGVKRTFAAGSGYFTAGFTAMNEVGSLVGITAPGFESGIGGQSAAIEISNGFQLWDSTGIRFEASAGMADGHGAGMIGDFNDIAFNSMKVTVDRALPNGALFSASVVRPAAIVGGTVDVRLPSDIISASALSDEDFRTYTADLAPTARQLDLNFEYTMPIDFMDDASVSLMAGKSLNQGHTAGETGYSVGIAATIRF